MYTTTLAREAVFDSKSHVEKILCTIEDGDVTVACWEPGQISPYHCHPDATEIYFCFQGSGTMRTPNEIIDVAPGGFVVHPPGEMHEYINGPERSLLFRVRYGTDMAPRIAEWPTNPEWTPTQHDATYFEQNPVD